MGTLVDFTGVRSGLLSVTSRAANSSAGAARWNCICECGVEMIVLGQALKLGQKSCGCLQRKKQTLDVLTATKCREFLDYNPDTGVFLWKKSKVKAAGRTAGTITSHGYYQISICCRVYYAHRLAWLYMTGEWPKDQVDHIDMDKSNNRFANLRESDASRNSANTKTRKNRSGLKGARWDKGKWSSTIVVNKKRIYLGRYEKAEDAHAAYRAAAIKYHGEFARVA